MGLSGYDLKVKESKDSQMVFEFKSEGTKGSIHKLIRFSESSISGIFYFEFGDKIEGADEIDITSVSNNGDRKKIYATLRSSIYAFTEKNMEAWVFLTGNTKAKTRLLRMEATLCYYNLKQDFVILGLRNGEWEDFQTDVDYLAIIMKRKGNLPQQPDSAFLPLIFKRYVVYD